VTLKTPARKPVTLGALWRRGAAQLCASGVETPNLDARVLLADVLGIEIAQLIADSNKPAGEEIETQFVALIARRAQGEPVARIVGFKEFWGRRFTVSPDVLVPRPETETLVEAVLHARPDKNARLRVLDLGTGSGALLAAILLERPAAIGIGVDRSEAAVKIARNNLALLGLHERAALLCGDWGRALGARFDVVVANPPYIATAEVDKLPREVRSYDPREALDSGTDGLCSYRAILADLKRLLAPNGMAVLELGAGQEEAVAKLARGTDMVIDGSARRDLSGHPRALVLGAGR
jgi:release factor glutamine methyltransferase